MKKKRTEKKEEEKENGKGKSKDYGKRAGQSRLAKPTVLTKEQKRQGESVMGRASQCGLLCRSSVSALLPSSQMPLTLLGRSLQAQVTDAVITTGGTPSVKSQLWASPSGRGGPWMRSWQELGPVILGKAQRQMLALTLGSHLQSPSRPPGWLCCRCKSFTSKLKSFSTAGRHSGTWVCDPADSGSDQLPPGWTILSLVQSSSP